MLQRDEDATGARARRALSRQRRQARPAHGAHGPHEHPLLEALGVDDVRARRDGRLAPHVVGLPGGALGLGRVHVHGRQADRAVLLDGGRVALAGLEVGGERGRKRARVVVPGGRLWEVEREDDSGGQEEPCAARGEVARRPGRRGGRRGARQVRLREEESGLCDRVGGEVVDLGCVTSRGSAQSSKEHEQPKSCGTRARTSESCMLSCRASG